MNTDPTLPRDDDPRLLAAEFTLGVLDADAHRAASRRLERDPAFAREVGGWHERMAPMLDRIDAVEPPPALWPRIRAALGLAAAPRVPPGQRVPLWQRLPFWQGFGAAGLAATAASLVAVMVLRGPDPDAGPRDVHAVRAPHPITLLTSLAAADGSAAFVAAVDADACTLLLMPTGDARVPAGKVAELWVITPSGTPRSLGVRTQAMQAVSVPAPLQKIFRPTTTLAVSIEPPGGSPTGQPTGAVIASGALASLVL
jgi:anti-sigma-K factor RskA